MSLYTELLHCSCLSDNNEAFRYALLRLRAQVFVVEQVRCCSASARDTVTVCWVSV